MLVKSPSPNPTTHRQTPPSPQPCSDPSPTATEISVPTGRSSGRKLRLSQGGKQDQERPRSYVIANSPTGGEPHRDPDEHHANRCASDGRPSVASHSQTLYTRRPSKLAAGLSEELCGSRRKRCSRRRHVRVVGEGERRADLHAPSARNLTRELLQLGTRCTVHRDRSRVEREEQLRAGTRSIPEASVGGRRRHLFAQRWCLRRCCRRRRTAATGVEASGRRSSGGHGA